MQDVAPRVTIVIFDNGTFRSRIGVAGEKNPRFILGTFTGTIKKGPIRESKDREQRVFMSEHAYVRRGICNMYYPLKERNIVNWENMERIWHHSYYNLLKIEPNTHPVMITEPMINPKKTREKIVDMMFQTFEVTDLLMTNTACLAMYSIRKINGVVLDLGHSLTTTTPVYEGYYIPNVTYKAQTAGDALTNYLMKVLIRKGYKLCPKADYDFVRQIKEKACYVCDDYANALAKFDVVEDSRTFPGPYGQEITVGKEMFQTCEALFQADITRTDEEPIQKFLHRSITKNEVNMQNKLLENIVIVGGTSKFPNFVERMEAELRKLLAEDINPRKKNPAGRAISRRVKTLNFVAPENRETAAFTGASILASLRLFEEKSMSKDEYEEHGASLVNRKMI